MKLGAAREQSRTAWRLVTIEIATDSAMFSYRLNRANCGRHDRAKVAICCAPTLSRKTLEGRLPSGSVQPNTTISGV